MQAATPARPLKAYVLGPRNLACRVLSMLVGTMSAAAQSTPQSSPRVDKPSVLVIGAGLIGSSVAMQIAKNECSVTFLEASAGPAAGDQAGCMLHNLSAKYKA